MYIPNLILQFVTSGFQIGITELHFVTVLQRLVEYECFYAQLLKRLSLLPNSLFLMEVCKMGRNKIRKERAI